MLKQWIATLVSFTSSLSRLFSHGIWDLCVRKRQTRHSMDFYFRGTMLCVCALHSVTTSVFWQGLLSQSKSNCLQPLPHRSWRGELRRILRSLFLCADAHTHTNTLTFLPCPCQVEHCAVAGGASGVQRPNVSSSINGCFSWLKGGKHLEESYIRAAPGLRRGTDWLTFSEALLNTAAL